MNKPIYQRFRFTDGTEHGMLRRDVLAREQEQLLALAKATGNYEPLHRWLESRAQQDFGLAAAIQAKHEQPQKARATRSQNSRDLYELIREWAAEVPDKAGAELDYYISVRWRDIYPEDTHPDKPPPTPRTIARAMNKPPG